jgi:hypothetical protein
MYIQDMSHITSTVWIGYSHVSGVPWRIITGSGLDDWIYWHSYYNHSKLESIITADDQWLPKTRSIPYWTTSVFSSTLDWLGSDL